MQIRLINLERAHARRRFMAAQFAALELEYQIVPAVDGGDVTPADRALVDHGTRRRYSAYPLTDNELGCWLSHRRAIAAVLESGVPMAAIVEDDAQLSLALPAALAALERCSVEFDIVFLHRNHKAGEIFAPARPLAAGLVLGRVGYSSMKATAYVISRRGAARFLAKGPRIVHALDMAMHRYWDNGLEIYGLNKPVASEDTAAYSYIEETRRQAEPQRRSRYADAESWPARARRRLARLEDSVHKRLAFARCRRAPDATAPRETAGGDAEHTPPGESAGRLSARV